MIKLGEETVQIPAVHQGKSAKEIVQQKKEINTKQFKEN